MSYKHLVIILLCSLPALLWWFGSGYVVDGTDISFPHNPKLALERSFSAWDNLDNNGNYNNVVQVHISRLSLYAFSAVLQALHVSPADISHAWYFTFILTPGLSFYFFVSQLNQKLKQYKLHSLFSALFYMYNPYYLQLITDQAIVLTYICVPLLLGLFLKAVQERKFFPSLFFIGLVWLFYLPINPNSYAVGILLVVFFITLLSFLVWREGEQEKIWFLKRFLACFLILSILINADVIISYGQFLSSELGSVQTTSRDWLTGISKYTPMSNTARLQGAWDWFESFNGEPYAPYAKWYAITSVKFLTLLLPVIAFLGIARKRDAFTIFFGLLAGAGIVLAAGTHAPTGVIYQWLYDHVPLFWIFRSPWYKFSFWITFAYAFFFGKVANMFLERVSIAPVRLVDVFLWKKKAIFYACVWIIMFLYLLFVSFPLVSGWRFTRSEERFGNLPAQQVKIPDYVYQAANFINDQHTSSSVLLIPQISLNHTNYSWGYGNLQSPLLYLLERNPLLYLPFDSEAPFYSQLAEFRQYFYDGLLAQAQQFANFLSARYLLQQEDFNYTPFRSTEDNSFFNGLLRNNSSFPYLRHFGRWTFYENKNAYPLFYTTKYLAAPESLADLANIVTVNPLAFSTSKQSLENIATIPITSRTIDPLSFIPIGDQLVGTFNTNGTEIGVFQFHDPKVPEVLISDGTTTHLIENYHGRGTVRFNHGEHILQVPVSYSDNLIRNQTFANNLQFWERANLTEEVLAKEQKPFQIPEPGLIRVHAPDGKIGFFEYINNEMLSSRTYMVSFDYQVQQGSAKFVFFEDGAGEIVTSQLTKSSQWASYQKIVRTRPQTQRFSVNFFAGPADDTIFLVKNVQVKLVSLPFYSIQVYPQDAWDKIQQLDKQNTQVLKVESEDKTGAILAVKIDVPTVLVFNESYHDLWKLSGDYPGIIPHFRVNDASNGFLLSQPGTYHLTLLFKPQTTLHIGFVITAMTFFVLLAFYIRSAVKSKRLL